MSSQQLHVRFRSVSKSSFSHNLGAIFLSSPAWTYLDRTKRYYSDSTTETPRVRPQLTKRSCLITGATSGIGYAVLTRLLADGASHIRVISRDGNRAQQVMERARGDANRDDGQVEVIEEDLNEPGFTSTKLFTANGDWPIVNTFIHCAGISQSSLATSTSATTRSNIMRVNAEAYMQLLADFLKSYHSYGIRSKGSTTTDRPSFCAVGISSLLANKGGYGTSTYAASKAAMIAYNRSICLEAAQIARKFSDQIPGFRVNTVVPGYIDTPMIKNFSQETKTDLESQIPCGRFGTADEVADAVMFLVNNEYANNCMLNLDGGLSAT